MEITYNNNKINKVCTDAKVAEKTYGTKMAEKIDMRIGEISAADTVEMMIQFHIGRCHSLSQNRKGSMLWTLFIRIGWYLRKRATKFKLQIS